MEECLFCCLRNQATDHTQLSVYKADRTLQQIFNIEQLINKNYFRFSNVRYGKSEYLIENGLILKNKQNYIKSVYVQSTQLSDLNQQNTQIFLIARQKTESSQ